MECRGADSRALWIASGSTAPGGRVRPLPVKRSGDEHRGTTLAAGLTREDADGKRARPELIGALGRLWGCRAGGHRGR